VIKVMECDVDGLCDHACVAEVAAGQDKARTTGSRPHSTHGRCAVHQRASDSTRAWSRPRYST